MQDALTDAQQEILQHLAPFYPTAQHVTLADAGIQIERHYLGAQIRGLRARGLITGRGRTGDTTRYLLTDQGIEAVV